MRVAAIDLGHEHHSTARRGRRRRARRRGLAARRRSRGSARASTRAASCCRCRSRASGTASPTTGASSSRSAPSASLRVATSAVRDAENGEAFLGEIEWSYGFTTRLLTGRGGGRLTLRGSRPPAARRTDAGRRHRRRLDRADRAPTRSGQHRPRLGSPDRAVPPADPPTEDELAEAAPPAALSRGRRSRPRRGSASPARSRRSPLSTSASSSTTTSASHGHLLGAAARRAQLDAPRRAPARRAPPGSRARARARAGDRRGRGRPATRCCATSSSPRSRSASATSCDGVALEAAKLPEPVEGDAPPGAYTCC